MGRHLSSYWGCRRSLPKSSPRFAEMQKLPLAEEAQGLALAMADSLDDAAAEAVAYTFGRGIDWFRYGT
ncbi:hypothetical protein SAMN06265365_101614 [Tistlia consotensis]|uniref:Uncharacterized protein n=1 Tax=Tistlia consotensis USBA 355 TaxID=560819 RepID=A0A1Y6B8A5_9PROT|nr:hypothetical protein [Tistlia consotensis]SME93831.1 hypothetical protein SAMN05428998_101613 [Tistlia consotensis USBA 355]SNR28841.1 hypothetical protein SAMN06265365_101614 [Tistlia consotensis]